MNGKPIATGESPTALKNRLAAELRSLGLDLLEVVSVGDSARTFDLRIQVRNPEPVELPSPWRGPQPGIEGLYYPDGKLNFQFMSKNAEVLFLNGEYGLARNIFKTILKSGEKSAFALYWIGRCDEAEERLDSAVAHYEESIAFHATLETYQRLARVLGRMQKDLQAAELLERALHMRDLKPETKAPIHLAAGNAYGRAQKLTEAERHYRAALDLDPQSAAAYGNLGQVLLEMGRTPDARLVFLEAIRIQPQDPKALAGLAGCCFKEGDLRQAHDFYARSLEIDLNHPTALFHLVKCAFEIKSYALAAGILTQYIETFPVNPSMLYSLAGLQFHLGRLDEARRTADRILALQPGYQPARELIQMIERVTQN